MGSGASSAASAINGASDSELSQAVSSLAGDDRLKLQAALKAINGGSQRSIVIVGWGPVGHSLLTKLLEKSAGACKVTVISEESYPAYNRVKLTTFFEHRDPGKLALSSPEWCEKNGVQLIFGRASKIDRAAQTVEYADLKGGTSGTVKYDELVLATGSKPFVPPITGLSVETAGIHIYRSIDDLFKITERAKTSKKAIIIGGGLLGLEAAKAAYDLKLETRILEVAPHLMPVQLDPEAGALLKTKIEAMGITVQTGVKILEAQSGPGGVTGIKIEEGGAEKVVECDLVIVSAGVRPRQDLAEGCSLELGGRGGVKVDYRMRSADEHVWAVGEIACLDGGMCYQMSAPGYAQAEVLAEHLTNPETTAKFEGADLSTKLKLLGVDVASFGGSSDFWFKRQYMSTDAAAVLNQVSKDEAKGLYKKLVFTPDGQRLLGGILVGDITDFTKLAAVAKRPDVGGLKPEEMLAGQMPKVNDGGDGTNLGDDDDVCNCHCVPKKVIREAIKAGSHTFGDIKKCTKAGTGCGTCISTGPQPKLLAHTLNELGVSKGCCKSLPFSLDDIEDLAKARQLKTYDELVANLGYPPAAEPEADKKALGGLLDRISGKPKGEGMSHVEQLKSLREDLWKFVDRLNCNPIFLRLAWHDAGNYDKGKPEFPDRGGANGSIIYEPEMNFGANNGLNKAKKYLDPFKADYPLVSWADTIQMAAAVGIEHCGGPKIDMKYGRKDVSGPEACPAPQSRGTGDNAGLPDAESGPDGKFGCGAPDPATHLRNIFYRMGFDDKGIVALSGAHTIGRAFKERSGTVAEGYGEASACPYTKSVAKGCPIRHDGQGGVGMPGGKSWTTKWLKFDNEYFQPHVSEEKDKDLAWFSSDRCLHQDESFKKYFMQYREDQAAFFKDFGEAMKQLSEQGSAFEPEAGVTI